MDEDSKLSEEFPYALAAIGSGLVFGLSAHELPPAFQRELAIEINPRERDLLSPRALGCDRDRADHLRREHHGELRGRGRAEPELLTSSRR